MSAAPRRTAGLTLLPADDGWEERHAEGEGPDDLALAQALRARRYLESVRRGRGLALPWTDLDRIVGRLLPGWLVFVGGRAKAGKTTALTDLLLAYSAAGIPGVYVGTETEPEVLRIIFAAKRLGIPVEAALDPASYGDAHDRILADIEGPQSHSPLAETAIFASDARDLTLDRLAYWVDYAAKHDAGWLIFDHLHRLELGGDEGHELLAGAVRRLKNLAVKHRLTLIVGAQLKQGEGGLLGEYEVPGNNAWFGTSKIQQEADVAIQLWRPFKPGVTAKQKAKARAELSFVTKLIQPNVMAVRVAAHRYRNNAMNQMVRLTVQQDRVVNFIPEGYEDYRDSRPEEAAP